MGHSSPELTFTTSTPQHKQMKMLRCLLSAPGRRLASAYWRAPVRSLSGGGLVTALAVGVGGAQAACGDDAAFTSAAIAPEPPARMPGFGNVHVLRRTPYTVLRVGERERERECVCVCVCVCVVTRPRLTDGRDRHSCFSSCRRAGVALHVSAKQGLNAGGLCGSHAHTDPPHLGRGHEPAAKCTLHCADPCAWCLLCR